MKRLAKTSLTKLELELMQIIWRLGSSTVAAVQAELSRPLAYTTVQTILNILERKGKLRRQRKGRAFVYSARVTESKALGQVVRDVIDRMFGGSSEELVMSLLKSGEIDADRLAELTQRFSDEEGKE